MTALLSVLRPGKAVPCALKLRLHIAVNQGPQHGQRLQQAARAAQRARACRPLLLAHARPRPRLGRRCTFDTRDRNSTTFFGPVSGAAARD